MKDKIYIGIDPGVGGGIAFLNGDELNVKNCPDDEFGMAEEISMCKDIADGTPIMACIEMVHSMPRQGVASTFKFGKNYGQWLGILAAHKIPFIDVSPYKWQKHFGTQPKDKGDRKRNLKRIAQQRYPDVKVTLKTADAILICKYIQDHDNQQQYK